MEIDLPIIGLTEKTKTELMNQRWGYDESVKEWLDKEGIEDINEYKEDVKTVTFMEDQLVDWWKIEEEALDTSTEASSFLKIVKEENKSSQIAENDSPIVLQEIKYKAEESISVSSPEIPLVKEIAP